MSGESRAAVVQREESLTDARFREAQHEKVVQVAVSLKANFRVSVAACRTDRQSLFAILTFLVPLQRYLRQNCGE